MDQHHASAPRGSTPLDAAEAHVLAWLKGEQSAPDPETILRDLHADIPFPDPEWGRRSSAELSYLLNALGVSVAAPPRTHHPRLARVGYRIEGHRGERPGVYPLFAAMLSQQGPIELLQETFDDLWVIDQQIHQELHRAPSDPDHRRRLVQTWLESPGRRLLQEIEILPRLPSEKPLGATDCRLERIYAAAGVAALPGDPVDAAAPPLALELRSILPGRRLGRWQPAPAPTQSLRALQLLEPSPELPPSAAGAALLWLFDRAARDPVQVWNGLRGNLRDALPSRLVTVLAQAQPAAAPSPQQRLEALTLQHAALITRSDDRPGALIRAFLVARWLYATLLRSPFGGQDADALSARLEALLPRELPPLRDDPLAPERFYARDGSGALRLPELILLDAVGQHFHPSREPHVLRSIPPALTQLLRQIADRAMCPAERDAEARRSAGSELRWPHPHVAPPLLSRYLLGQLKQAWLADAREAVQDESLALLETSPAEHHWLIEALYQERARLSPPLRERALRCSRGLVPGARALSVPAYSRALLGMTVLDLLSEPAEQQQLLALCEAAEGSFPPYLLDQLGQRADEVQVSYAWELALAALLRSAQDLQAPEENRVLAAVFAVRRLSASPPARRKARLPIWLQLCKQPPFADVVELQRELRRLGHSAI